MVLLFFFLMFGLWEFWVKGVGNWENLNLGKNRVILELFRVLIFVLLVKELYVRFFKIY